MIGVNILPRHQGSKYSLAKSCCNDAGNVLVKEMNSAAMIDYILPYLFEISKPCNISPQHGRYVSVNVSDFNGRNCWLLQLDHSKHVHFDFCCALLVLLRSEERWGRY